MSRKVKVILAIAIIVVGVGVASFPLLRTWYNDAQTSNLLGNLEAGDAAMTVDLQPVEEGDQDSWAEADGLSDFTYEEGDDWDASMRLEGELTNVSVEIGEDDGVVDPEAVGEPEIGEMALDPNAQAEVLDVEGLKKKRLVAIGKIEIPVIEANLPIVEGAGKTELHYAVGHVTATADFGRTGNCVLAGHRNYTYGSMLNRLDEVQPGDEIALTMRDGTVVRYEVYECVVVEPGVDDISNFEYEERRLTIVTCTPLGVATHRLLVRAHVVEITPPVV